MCSYSLLPLSLLSSSSLVRTLGSHEDKRHGCIPRVYRHFQMLLFPSLFLSVFYTHSLIFIARCSHTKLVEIETIWLENRLSLFFDGCSFASLSLSICKINSANSFTNGFISMIVFFLSVLTGVIFRY